MLRPNNFPSKTTHLPLTQISIKALILMARPGVVSTYCDRATVPSTQLNGWIRLLVVRALTDRLACRANLSVDEASMAY
jgi:hypothetical protein